MGTHPIFESDFDCLTELNSYGSEGCCRAPLFDLEMDPLLISTLVLVVFVTLFFVWRRSLKSRGSDILFVGLSHSGKTVLVSKLVDANAEPITQTSVRPNEINFKVDDGKDQFLLLVDIPGNERLRINELQKYKHSTRGIVFVVNSETVARDIRDVAELIYQILTDSTIHQVRPKILIAANKQDTTIAKAGVKIKEMIENELTLLRKTQTAALQDTDDENKSDVYLGKKGTSSFDLSQLPMDVEVHECSGKNADVDAVKSWLFSCT